MNDYPDNELIDMISESNEEASNILYDKYNFIVTAELKRYLYVSKQLGIDYAELRQEALVGFSDALANYNQDKGCKLSTFITLCIERRLSKFIRKMDTKKEQINQGTISLDQEIDEEFSLYDVLGDSSNDPQMILEEDESAKSLLEEAEIKLSSSEKEVLDLILSNYSYDDIAKKLGVPIKSIYNCIARIRNKLKK